MSTAQPSADATHGLDLRVLALATAASVLGWVVSSAFGAGLLATAVCAAVLPSITAFVTLPAPRNTRVRRGAVVLVFAALVAACRRATGRTPDAKPHHVGGEVGCVPGQLGVGAVNNTVGAATAQVTHAWLSHVAITAAIAVAPAAVALTAREVIRGDASGSGSTVRAQDGVQARADSHTTTVPRGGASSRPDGAKPTVSVPRDATQTETTGGRAPIAAPASKGRREGPGRRPGHRQPGSPPDANPAAPGEQRPQDRDDDSPPVTGAQGSPEVPGSGSQAPAQAPGGHAPTPIKQPLDLTGNWQLDLWRPDIRREPVPIEHYAISLHQLDESKCSPPEKQCYGGQWYNIDIKNCGTNKFIATATMDPTSNTAQLRATDVDDRGEQTYTGTSNDLERRNILFKGRWTWPGTTETPDFHFTRCSEASDACVVHTGC